VRRGWCQLRDTVLPTLVRLTRRALKGGPTEPSSSLLVTPQGQSMTSGRRSAIPSLSVLCGHPRPCCATSRVVTTAPVRLSTRRRDAATPVTAPRTERCQRLPRARLKVLRSTTTPLPSKLLLFKHRTRHDAATGARFARTAVNSSALCAMPPHVAK
jgi:hypothetical protein